MAGPISAASGRIFISYRREETAYPAGWLYDRLADHFGGNFAPRPRSGDHDAEQARIDVPTQPRSCCFHDCPPTTRSRP
jgi:hypothetical protein